MKRITVMKTLPYDVTLAGKYGLYEGYCRSTVRSCDPSLHVNSARSPKLAGKIVLCSSYCRTQQTAKLLGGAVETNTLLDEVSFDLSSLLNKAEFDRYGSMLVRQRFLRAFENDSLVESRAQLFTRVRSLQKLLREHPGDDIYCISHSFFMKIFQAYIETSGKVETQPEILKKYIKYSEPTYPYGKGFQFKL